MQVDLTSEECEALIYALALRHCMADTGHYNQQAEAVKSAAMKIEAAAEETFGWDHFELPRFALNRYQMKRVSVTFFEAPPPVKRFA